MAATASPSPPSPPTSLDAVTVDSDPVVTVFGSGFFSMTDLQVDGVSLSTFPPTYTISSDSQIDIFTWPLVSQTGSVTIEAFDAGGSDTGSITINANDPPVIDLVGSDPDFIFNVVGIDVTMGGEAGDVVWLNVSGDNTPSVLPGIVDFDIGGNFSSLFSLGVYTIGSKGWERIELPTALPPGTTIHVQANVLTADSPFFPMEKTNLQSGTVLF